MNKLDFSEIFRLYPSVLKEDKEFNAIGVALTIQLLKNVELTGREIIYPRIESLLESVLDALAFDFNVEWYDYEGTIDEKRRTIAECMNIHKFKGTKAAILTALKSVYDDVRVLEWYEYGGEPFHFKIIIRHSHSGYDKLTRLLQKVKYYKNVRSHLEETEFNIDLSPPPATAYIGTVNIGFERADGAVAAVDILAAPTLEVPVFAAMWVHLEAREIGAVLHYALSEV